MGYYTLCAMAISQGDVPKAARKHIPRYPLVSATLIGRLAVLKDRQGQRLGAVLLADALQRAFESASTVGSSMVIVDALDEPAAGFYAAHGFVRLPTRCGSCCRCASPAKRVNHSTSGVHLDAAIGLMRMIEDDRYVWVLWGKAVALLWRPLKIK